jgi:hypothetical protein
MTKYETIGECNSRYGYGRWTLTPESSKAAKKLGMRTHEFLQTHVDMALHDEIWLFHRKIATGHYELVVAEKHRRK